MEMTGAEIVVRCLEEEGVKHVFGYPGGAVLYIYDALYANKNIDHILVRHEQAAVHAADAYSRSTAGGGRLPGHLGSGSDQRGHRDRHRLHGFDPAGGAERPGPDPCDRPGRVPGVRHGRHHPAVRQAQLPGQERQGPGDHDASKAFHIAAHRPARARCWSTSPRTSPATSAASSIRSRCRCAPTTRWSKGHQGQIKKALQLLLAAERPMIYTGGGVILANASEGAEPARRPARVPVHQHPDGAGRLQGERPEVRRHAGHARHLRGQHGDAALRRAGGHRCALRRPRDRQSRSTSRRTRARSSTSTSIRRRSPSGSRSTCRSWATSASA